MQTIMSRFIFHMAATNDGDSGALVLAGLAVLGLAYVMVSILLSMIAARWPSVEGEVVRVKIEEDDSGESTIWDPVIEYKYTVRGHDLVSTRLGVGFMPSSVRFFATRIAHRYRLLPPVRVYYNPKRPYEAMLLVGFRWFHVFQGAIFAALLFLAFRMGDPFANWRD